MKKTRRFPAYSWAFDTIQKTGVTVSHEKKPFTSIIVVT